MGKIEIINNYGDYEVRAYNFVLAQDMYMFFRFKSPKSDCEIAIAYDEFVNGGDWYVNDGEFDYDADQEIVDDIIFDGFGRDERLLRLYRAIDAAIDEFNKSNR